MAASNGSPPVRQPRVPAWKRLGLKLKYAKDDAGPNPPSSSNRGTTFSSSLETGSEDQAPNDDSSFPPVSKKRKTNHVDPNQAEHSVANSITRDPPTEAADVRSRESSDVASVNARIESPVTDRGSELEAANDSRLGQSRDSSSHHIKETSEGRRRKSVTFASDTKDQDGSSAVELSNEVILETSPTNIAESSAVGVAKTKAKKRKKRASDDKSPPVSSSATSSAVDEGNQAQSSEIPAYVAYLDQFYTDKSSWKFNKNKQNDLIKNLFNFDRIPAEHDNAIQLYIAGLQSSAARQRIIERATEILLEIAKREDDFSENMESEEARRAAYSAALQRHLARYKSMIDQSNEHDDQEIEEMRREAERGKRAEAVLGELLQKALHSDREMRPSAQSQQISPSNHDHQTKFDTNAITKGSGSTKKTASNRKKRKMRTQASADDSDSSSSEDEEHRSSQRGPSTIQDALKVKQDSSSNIAAKSSSLPKGTGTRKIFDDDLLDRVFPKK